MPTETLLQTLMATAEICGSPFSSAGVARLFLDDVSGYPEPQLLAALKRCRLEHKGRLTVADVLSRIDDGRPGVETAWAQIATLADERKSLVWCEEMRTAWAVALPLLDSGDKIAARMAFKEEYTRLLAVSRRERTPPRWTLTPGSDPDHREQAVTTAAALGLISAEYAAKLLPYHQAPTPAGQALLEAAAQPKRLVSPEAPEPAAPPVPVAERLAALRAAVMGAPAWSPPPRAAPRPPRSSAELDRLPAETVGGSAPEPAKAVAAEASLA